MAEVKDDIASMAGYLPYLAQIAGWHYFRAWKEKGQLGSETKALVRRRFEDDARAHFDAVWNRYLGDAERAALQELTEGKRNQKQYILRPLEKKGYVADGRVASEAFTEYIRRQAPEQQAKVPPEPEAPSTGLWVDTASGYVYRDGKPIQPPLTDKEYRLVELLYQSRGKICTPYMIVEAVWGEDYIEDVDDSRIAALTYRLRKKNLYAKTITLKIRYKDFQTFTYQKTMEQASNLYTDFATPLKELFKKRNRQKQVRLIGVGLSHLQNEVQLELFGKEPKARLEFEARLDKLRDKYGVEVI